MSLNAYRRAQKIAATPRSTEYQLMSQITGAMITARDAGATGSALAAELHHNRMAWSTFANMCATKGNQLPDELRASIISLAIWVEKYTSDVMRNKGSIDDLIDVNRAIIDGLANTNGG